MMGRKQILGSVFSILVAGAVVLWPARSEASIIDLGVQGGVLKRSLSDVDYNTSFAWQLHGEMTFFPFLMAGPYVTFTSATADVSNTETPSKIDFRTLGVRLKLKIPVTDSVAPFGVAGMGWAHANFPDQILTICEPGVPACLQRSVTNATANFAEFLLGGGVQWTFAAPFAVSAEFNWRPTSGYTNDVYERQVQSKQTTAPDPSRNGVAWVGLIGLELTL
jgi:opacity protein-like surface antigen